MNRYNIWLGVLTIVYVLLSYVVFQFVDYLSFVSIVVVVLSSVRLTRFIVKDIVFNPVHSMLEKNINSFYELPKVLLSIIKCPWCTGLWTILAVIFLYTFSPFTAFLVIVLAIATMVMFIYLLITWLGWSAEKNKIESEK